MLELIDSQIKKILSAKSMSIKKLAAEIDMTEQGYHYMIKKQSMKVDTLAKISQVLGVPITFFFEEGKGVNQVVLGDGNKQLINSVDYSNMEKDLATCLKENELLKNQLKDKERIIQLMERK